MTKTISKNVISLSFLLPCILAMAITAQTQAAKGKADPVRLTDEYGKVTISDFDKACKVKMPDSVFEHQGRTWLPEGIMTHGLGSYKYTGNFKIIECKCVCARIGSKADKFFETSHERQNYRWFLWSKYSNRNPQGVCVDGSTHTAPGRRLVEEQQARASQTGFCLFP